MLSITAARGKELLQVTLAAPLASRQIVGRLGRVFVRGIVAMMRGHMGKAVEDVDRIGVVYHLHAFAHILYRHAVVVLVQRDVTVALDRGNRPLSHLIAVRGQRPQTVSLSRWSQTADGGIPCAGSGCAH